MPRASRIINYTLTSSNTWYKVFDEVDYKKNRVREVRMKMRETSTADHFRYNFDGSTTVFLTSTSGVITVRDVPKIYAYVPTEASQVLELEIIYE